MIAAYRKLHSLSVQSDMSIRGAATVLSMMAENPHSRDLRSVALFLSCTSTWELMCLLYELANTCPDLEEISLRTMQFNALVGSCIVVSR